MVRDEFLHGAGQVSASRRIDSPPKVLKLAGEDQSYRESSHRLELSNNTVLDIVKSATELHRGLRQGVTQEESPCEAHQ